MKPEDDPTDLLDTVRLEAVLNELADRLADHGIAANLYIVGGAALALSYYHEGERRLTNDVDASFFPVEEVAIEAEALAPKYGLRPGWLNAKAAQFFPAHGLPDGSALIERDRVAIVVGPPRLILAMKLRAARLGRDNDDVAVLIRRCDMRSVEEAEAVLLECYEGEEPFKPVARAIVETALGRYEVRSARPPFTLEAMPSRS
jgi:hypothetical protein